MFWRVVHDTLKWVWPALFACGVAISGGAIGASQVWPEAKVETARRFAEIVSMLGAWTTWLALFVVFVVWLAAFIWSGHKAEAARGALPGTPPAIQDRKQAGHPTLPRMSPRVIDAHNRDASEFWLRRVKVALKSPSVAQGLRDGLLNWRRDAKLSDALMFACSGVWQGDMTLTAFTVEDFEKRKVEIEQLAMDGHFAVSGKPRSDAVYKDFLYEQIPAAFWRRNRVNWSSLILQDDSYTEPRSGDGDFEQFECLMVFKAEFEEAWNGRRDGTLR